MSDATTRAAYERATYLGHYPETPEEWQRRMDVLLAMPEAGLCSLLVDALIAGTARLGLETLEQFGHALAKAADEETDPGILALVRDRWSVVSEHLPPQ